MASKKDQLAQDIAKAVGAGKAVSLETVDFNDPNRPKTCLEIDFPILPVNQVAVIEGNASKPIYQMSKWWARRRSSVFRSMLISAATKAPEDKSHAAKLVWDNYYANHQKKGAFKNLKVADIFMGGGTTLVEGSRLGMQMVGNDLNPVAWFVVKQELADVDLSEVNALLADIEAQVKPQIMPFMACNGPNGEKGKWTHLPSKKVMPTEFDPLTLSESERPDYRYDGPEVIYTFWAKHGPCQVTGCGHRTPIMSSNVIAIKSISVKHWQHSCRKCGTDFHVEADDARMAPDVPLYVSDTEDAFSVLDRRKGVICPSCGDSEIINLGKGTNKKVELSLLMHPGWLSGSPSRDAQGQPYGGTAQDNAASTASWDRERASHIRLLEVRGTLPDEVTCPESGIVFAAGKGGGTVPKKAHFTCGACGTVQSVLETVKASRKTGPMAGYAIHGYSPARDKAGAAYNGRFFARFDDQIARQYDVAAAEWESRKNTDLAGYWPISEVPYGFMTALNNGDIRIGHGYTHWSHMFNPRQLLCLSQLLKGIMTIGSYADSTREALLGAFQQSVRYQNMFCFWDINYDKMVPHMSNNNYHPKTNIVEGSCFGVMGSGRWSACASGVVDGIEWRNAPYDLVSPQHVAQVSGGNDAKQPSVKAYIADPADTPVEITAVSSTELSHIADASVDLVVTDPPFGGLLHYSELSDFFYVWLRLPLKDRYSLQFGPEYTPKSLEAVSNKAREPEDPDGFYKRLLTQCWAEANRILKPGGILTFTFHHSADEPWVAVLESLFESGYYLESTYPIRSDETKGEGAKPGTFGSQTIEYDIIHVCRKRTEEPKSVSWGRMRREVMADVRQLQALLENHAKEGLPAADLQVIRRGKALEYFSRHYGKVYVDEGRTISVKDALVGINQLIDEDSDKGKEPPPVNAEPITRQFLRTFGSAREMKRDQLQKFLRGSITTPDEFEQRGWCTEKAKVITRVDPLAFARDWSGRHKRRLTSDLDQALVLIGSCFDGSGISASDTLKNENFKPHIALKPLLEWLQTNGSDQPNRNAATRALTIYNSWAASQAVKPHQGSLFEEYEV